jgi:hypothetical protein
MTCIMASPVHFYFYTLCAVTGGVLIANFIYDWITGYKG